MDKDKNIFSITLELLRYFTITFTSTIIAITVMGILNTHFFSETQRISNLIINNEGLSYNSIVQIAGLTFILAVIAFLLFSEYFTIKIRFFWRFSFLLLAVFFITAISIIVFNWFNIHDLRSWFYFILSSAVCFIAVITWVFLRNKLESKKVNQLLKDYKVRHKFVNSNDK